MRAEETADRSGADDCDGHFVFKSVSATERRWILPVAVVGILSTM
jgi:hypothetical protein